MLLFFVDYVADVAHSNDLRFNRSRVSQGVTCLLARLMALSLVSHD